MTYKIKMLLTAAVVVTPLACMAQPMTGPYVSLGAGASFFQDQPVHAANIPDLGLSNDRPGNYRYSVGPAGEGSLGWGFGNGFRAEVTGLYERDSINKFGGLNGNGHSNEYGGFLNGLYDFYGTPAAAWGIVPYLGAGAGYTRQSFRNAGGSSADGTAFELNSGRNGLAVDGIAGVAYDVGAVPGLAITAEYRFIAVPHRSDESGYASVPGFGSGALNARAENLYTHTLLLGVRYALWQPPEVIATAAATTMAPPPPAAPPPAAETRTYLVFFDWDRADLTTRASDIIAEAARNSTRVATTRLEVSGYTDRSGTPAYNVKLSVRRAEAVQAALVKDGVAAAEIDIHGYGEANPLVPTAPGVREPQNRRVEIVLK